MAVREDRFARHDHSRHCRIGGHLRVAFGVSRVWCQSAPRIGPPSAAVEHPCTRNRESPNSGAFTSCSIWRPAAPCPGACHTDPPGLARIPLVRPVGLVPRDRLPMPGPSGQPARGRACRRARGPDAAAAGREPAALRPLRAASGQRASLPRRPMAPSRVADRAVAARLSGCPLACERLPHIGGDVIHARPGDHPLRKVVMA